MKVKFNNFNKRKNLKISIIKGYKKSQIMWKKKKR